MDFNFDFNDRHDHRKPPSSSDHHFFPVFSPSVVNNLGGGELDLDEEDVFWTGDFAQKKIRSTAATSSFDERVFVNRSSFRNRDEKFGILAALSDESKFQSLNRNSQSAIRKREVVTPQAHKFNFSAPVNVPVMSKEMMMKSNARRSIAYFNEDDEDENEMLPPHEIVARGSALTPNTTFSMLEGAGRTLKGRDLRQVRNAVFRQTGFVD